MKILHYALGFPPYRSGGLTKFCMDLIYAQQELGHDTGLLWPGEMRLWRSAAEIRMMKARQGVQSFQLVNPLPVPLDEGIRDISGYMKKSDKRIFQEFLKEYAPDVIHIHTLMGLYEEFLEAAKELNIRTVFSAHDYFGLCPRVTLYSQGECCRHYQECDFCADCNRAALSGRKIFLLQSALYRRLKESLVVRYLRGRHRNRFFEAGAGTGTPEGTGAEADSIKAGEYKRLREYYIHMLKSMDILHFNSTVTRSVYRRFFEPERSELISITHRGIADHRQKKQFGAKIRISFLGQPRPEKGFFLLKECLDELWREQRQDFCLRVFRNIENASPYMVVRGAYQYEELGEILKETDVVAAPSLCYETFGFVVIEALSYGVPVIVSDRVGAKDVMEGYDIGMVYPAEEPDRLKEIFRGLTAERLQEWNENILKHFSVKKQDTMVQEIMELYSGCFQSLLE